MLHGAIIGVGKIAQNGHLPAFADQGISGRAQIVAGADPNAESLRIAAERFPALRLYGSAEEMLHRETVDFVDICATPDSHGGLILAAAERGLHVLCEKPLTASPAESEAVLALHRSSGKALVIMPCHQYRYSPLWRRFKSFVAALAPGDGCMLQFNVFRSEADPGLTGGRSIWRTDQRLSGGGILADTGVHYLYLCLWMLGVPHTVTARTQRIALNGRGVEDTATAILEYDHRLAQINLTWGADRRANSACIVSKRGSLVYDGSALVRLTGGTREVFAVPDASDKSHYVALYVSLIEDFLKKISSGEECGPDIDEADQTVRLLEASYRSAALGATVVVDGGM